MSTETKNSEFEWTLVSNFSNMKDTTPPPFIILSPWIECMNDFYLSAFKWWVSSNSQMTNSLLIAWETTELIWFQLKPNNFFVSGSLPTLGIPMRFLKKTLKTVYGCLEDLRVWEPVVWVEVLILEMKKVRPREVVTMFYLGSKTESALKSLIFKLGFLKY